MKIDLNIAYDDLSEECKAKITKLKKMFGRENINIVYPDVSKFVSPADDWTKQITVPSPSWPNVKFPEITCVTTQPEDNTQLVVRASNASKTYGVSKENTTCMVSV